MADSRQPLRIVAAPKSLPIVKQLCPAQPKRLARGSATTDEAALALADRDPYAVTALADITDRSLHAATARFTGGLSPAALVQAYSDWATHLAASPGKRLLLMGKAARKTLRFGNYAFAMRSKAPARRTASSRCRRIGALPPRNGGNGRSTSSPRLSCCSSNGGTTPRPACAAYRKSTRTWSSSRRARSST